MMKQIVVLVLLVVLVLCFTSDARRTRGGVRRIRKCIERENTRCRYARKCVKAATKCVQRKRVKHCARFGTRRIAKRVTRKVCLKVRGGKASKKCLRCAKWGTKTVRKYSTKKVCVRHVTRTSCTKHKNVCVRHATKRVCSVVEPKIIVTGPKRCRRGFSLKFKKTGRRVRRFCKRNPVKPRVYTLKTCSSYLDPHTTGFDGRNFEFQVEGDFLMAETSDAVFSLHQRLKRFGGYTGTVAMAVRVNGVDVLEYLGSGRFLLNGKSVNVANGVALGLPNSGSVKKTGNVITVESPNGAKAVYTEYGQAANLVAFVPSDLGVKGYCSGTNLPFWMKNTASGLFHDKLRVRFAPGAIPKPHFTKRAKRNARTRCRGQGLRGARLANCVHDSLILRNHPNQRRLMIHIVKRIKKQIRRARKIHNGKVRRIIRRAHRRARRFHRRSHRRARRHIRRARRHHARRHRRSHRRARRAVARASGHGRRRGGWLRRALRRL